MIFKRFSLWVWFSFNLVFPLYASSPYILFSPQSYAGPRGTEKMTQLNGMGRYRSNANNYEVSAHLETELFGRRDSSFDIDTAWYDINLWDSVQWRVGRFHPSFFTAHEFNDWGLYRSSRPQNFGLQLGYGFENALEPTPMQVGWLGVHLWSGKDESPFHWGVSVTPFFFPSSEPELTLSTEEAASVGRFGRRPPSMVDWDHKKYPTRYKLNNADVVKNTVLNPQAMLHFEWKSSGAKPLIRNWFGVEWTMKNNPSLDASETVKIRDEKILVELEITPRFERQTVLFWEQAWDFFTVKSNWLPKYFIYTETNTADYGLEMGLRSAYYLISFMHQWEDKKRNARYYVSGEKFTNRALQVGFKIPWNVFTLSMGAIYHLGVGDYWFRSGVYWQATKVLGLGVHADFFEGKQDSYFGEWRTNSRVVGSVQWNFGI